jgi:hypothetical protein
MPPIHPLPEEELQQFLGVSGVEFVAGILSLIVADLRE